MDAAVGCSYCGQRSLNLLRCSRCKEVYYCSKDCQRGHWREGHREQCVAPNSQGIRSSTDTALECSYCSRRSQDVLRCSRCKEVCYCSKDCQRGHWREGHREQCVAPNSQGISSSTDTALECGYCSRRSRDVLRCSRCKEVYYCSKDCQRGHWREGHTEHCKIVGSQDSMVCRFCNESSKHLKKCIGCLQVSYCSKECQKEDWSQRHKVECKVIKPLELNMTCQTTKSEVKKEKEKLKTYERQNKTEDGKSSELLDCCSVCGNNSELKTCKECHKIRYCSRECQRVDWKTHKTNCKKEKGETENHGEQETLSVCAHCRVKGSHNACKYCSAVFYCSETCQQLDRGKHKTTCKLRTGKTKILETLTVEQCSLFGLVTPEENNGVDPNDAHVQIGDKELTKGLRLFCNRCKDQPSILTCPNCNSATYCSVFCCDQDKDDHKEICRTIQVQKFQEGPSSFPSSTALGFIGDTSNKMNFCSVNHAPSHSMLSFLQNPLHVQDNADLTLVIERSATSCERAREKIKRRFPNYILITRIREIPMEKISVFGSNFCTQPFVFLSYIRRFHGYRGRHNVYLQDSERRGIYVSFYLANDDPLPHFRWSDVVPGKFIAILFPCIHLFRDKSIGLRIDKATNAYIFNIKD